MEEYKASIANVDTALNRLNQTLASYKLLASSSEISRPLPSANAQTSLPGLDTKNLPPLPGFLRQREPGSPLPPLRRALVNGILALRSGKDFPEVRSMCV